MIKISEIDNILIKVRHKEMLPFEARVRILTWFEDLNLEDKLELCNINFKKDSSEVISQPFKCSNCGEEFTNATEYIIHTQVDMCDKKE